MPPGGGRSLWDGVECLEVRIEIFERWVNIFDSGIHLEKVTFGRDVIAKEREAGCIRRHFSPWPSCKSFPPEISDLEHQCPVDDLIVSRPHQSCVIVNQIEIAGGGIDPAQQDIADDLFPPGVVVFIVVPLHVGFQVQLC